MPQFNQRRHEGASWLVFLGIALLLSIIAYVSAPWFQLQSVSPWWQAILVTPLGGLPVFVGVSRVVLQDWPRLLYPREQWSFTCQAMADVGDALVMLGGLYAATYWGAVWSLMR